MSIDYIKIHSVLYSCMSFGKYVMACIHCHSVVQNSFIVLGAPVYSSLPSLPSIAKLLATSVTVHNFTFCRGSIIWTTKHLCSLFRLASLKLNNMCLRSLSFHGLIDHFFLLLNSIPLYGCITFCLSTHWGTFWLFLVFDS